MCPVCDRQAKRYKRKLHTEMALFLVKLRRLSTPNGRWVEVREIISAVPKASTDGSYLRLWGLLEKKGVGLYRVTRDGALFVDGQLSVEKYAHTFNGEAEKFSGPFISIDDALGDKFSVSQLLGSNK
jgi:hypothetical protein